MKNSKSKTNNKPASKSKVYTQKKPAAKKKKPKVTINNVNYDVSAYPSNIKSDTYTTSDTSKTTYISVDADTLGKYPVVNTEPSITVYSDKDANGTVNLQDAYNNYSKVVEQENSEDTKRSEMLPQNNDHTNMIVILIGVAAFAALLLLLV